jgi:D-amino-acid oxidase
MDVTVVGAGVSGLTCGVRLLEEGCRVTIVARELPAETTSAVAGAVWFPYRVAPNERTGPWAEAGYRRFAALAGDASAPVTMVELTMLYPEPLREEPWWAASVPGARVRASRPDELPDGYGDGRTVRVPCIQAPAYLDWLVRRFESLGGALELREVASLEETVRGAGGFGSTGR